LARGYVSNIALPLSDSGRTFGGLSIYSAEANAFDDEEVHLLEEMANDLAYGIITLRTRTEHEQHATILRQSLEQSIQTIAGTVEARDPYTAGHQRRVSELAAAIALEMGLPEEQVNGIHLAAMIHDVGKIHIPAEILSKPGKLNDIEFMLVKTHPQSGYDILKGVKFPWPIADIILQHHERMDGSGYPQGLKDGEILLESRIMAVADVVEAMSSHRPYRPALGIMAALSEIDRGRRSVYDPEVVDACLRLFVEKRFAFSSTST
jgi:putative nucleotidyltransferase with HDIG domain